MKYVLLAAMLILLLVSFSSCKKFIEVDPPSTQLESNNVFTNDVSATAAVLGIYSKMMSIANGIPSGTQSIGLLTGLSSDEFKNYSIEPAYGEFYTNSLTKTNDFALSYWSEIYGYVNNANVAIEGLTGNKAIPAALNDQLLGEAKFIRAFCYLYLTGLFGDVPLITSSDYRYAATAPRAKKSDVLQQVITDLQQAKALLRDDYLSGSNSVSVERGRPNKWAATALLARAYLYNGEWAKAEGEATLVIGNTGKYSLPGDLNDVFLKNSSEAIWQLVPVFPGFNTFDGLLYILNYPPGYVSLTSDQIAAFEVGDQRRNKWTQDTSFAGESYSYPFKYKVQFDPTLTEYFMVLRLAEQYLIRAEARTQLNNIGGAASDINAIRTRAGLGNTPSNNKASLLLAIEHERRVELFTEWGHRWFDLVRWNRATPVLSVIKGSSWQPTDTLYPINQAIIDRNTKIEQNTGY